MVQTKHFFIILYSASIHVTYDHTCTVFNNEVFIFGNYNVRRTEEEKNFYTMELEYPFGIQKAGKTATVS